MKSDYSVAEASKKFYFMLDIVKFVCCFFVVALHTGFLSAFDDSVSYWLEKALFRIAVPFYFITSGFLLGEKMSNIRSIIDIKKMFVHYSKRLFVLLLIFEPISIILDSLLEVYRGQSVFKGFQLKMKGVIFYPQGALWFIQACIVAVWIIYFFIRYNKKHLILPTACLLYAFSMLCNSYYFVIEGTVFQKNVDTYLDIALSARNGLFVGFIFIYLGILISDINRKKNIRTWKLAVSTLCLYCLYIFELYMVRNVKMKDDGSLFIILPMFCVSLCLLCVKYTSDSSNTKILRNLSTGVYLIHAPLRTIYFIYLDFIGYSPSGVVKFTVISLLAIFICLLSYRSKNKSISNLLR